MLVGLFWSSVTQICFYICPLGVTSLFLTDTGILRSIMETLNPDTATGYLFRNTDDC